MIKKIGTLGGMVIGSFVAVLIAGSGVASAAFNPHRVADDQVFDNTGAMNAEQVDAFLNTFPSSCISSNNGFSAPDPTGYSPGGGFTYGGNVSAGTVIKHAASAYDLNPQVLVVTLQKEQGLVGGGSGCSTLRYVGATGYGCPDSGTTHSYSGLNLYTLRGNTVTSVSGTCVNSAAKAGFSQQVIRAAWLLKFGQERAVGNSSWAIVRGSWDNSDDLQSCYSGPTTTGTFKVCPSGSATYHDGWSTIDGTAVHMESGATAALYWYTPHLHGNQVFFDTFSSWFGAPYAQANDYTFVTSWASGVHYNPGGTGSVTVVIKNTGYTTWFSDTNLPAGERPTRLATAGYQNSPFITPDSNALGTRNQVRMTPDTVGPGQNATFTFNVTAPYQTITSHTHLIPMIGGAFMKDTGIDAVLSADPPAWNPTDSSVDTRNLLPNQQSHASFTVQYNSDITWYSDGNVPAGKQPTRLAAYGYQESPFADTSDPNWLGSRGQIKMNEASVAPGGTATFDAWFIAPISGSAVNNQFHFGLVVGGVFAQDKGLAFNFTAPAANLAFNATSVTNPPATMTAGQTAAVTFAVQNTGNVVWHDELFQSGTHALRLIMTHPQYRLSSFYDSGDATWLSAGQLKKPTNTTWPGESNTFSFNWKAPSQAGTYHEAFQLAVGGTFYPDYGSTFTVTVP